MDHSEKDKKTAAVLNSFDGAERATPAPFLLTRIRARLANEEVPNFWSRAGALISRPLVAGLGMTIFVAANFFALTTLNKTPTSKAVANPLPSGAKYEFAINVSSLYDIENQEP